MVVLHHLFVFASNTCLYEPRMQQREWCVWVIFPLVEGYGRTVGREKERETQDTWKNCHVKHSKLVYVLNIKVQEYRY